MDQRDQEYLDFAFHHLRKDGWVFLGATGDRARIQTKPFTLFEDGIEINANAKYGEIRYQLTNEKSEPIEGYGFDDCVPIRGEDGLEIPLQWKNPEGGEIVNRTVRLEIKFRQANLYSIGMHHHFLDAQDKWLLEDGKPIPAKRFNF